MTDRDEQRWPEPPVAGDETATLLGSLERQRATLAWKCGGLDAAGLRATLAPSSITLGGRRRSRRRWPKAAWNSWAGSPGPTGGHPACGVS